MFSFTDYLLRYPDEMGLGTEPAEAVFDRYHVPDFVLHNDGLPMDRDRLIAHARPARRNATAVSVDIHEVLTAGQQVAARYTLTARLRQGRTVTTEIYTFGSLAPDGRLARLDQITRTPRAGAE
ncbi:nuclear transport factor 2 family protein [Actinoplanes aureus]|uniref:Nuclear transport factor 2 family protein n=1 Tax=Actinoplanes aureus TaxID=2792083 RepID=A0A931C3G8_9ACTN|nr:nuclear transport factor 2 family protein [Actinoplanes aureus]MBG0562700.1 nuclear transport factor 2 family protein [Actinoplanes aureus]